MSTSDTTSSRTVVRARWTLGLLALAACAPTEEVIEVAPIIEPGITEQEVAEGADDPGTDRVEPWEGIDGDVSALAPETLDPPEGTSVDGVSTAIQALQRCSPTTGYSHGRPVRICVTTVDGRLVEYRTAEAFLRMRSAASRAGVRISIVSGFRTMTQQRALYAAYRAGRGNLAAPPGYSNHQSGLALDLTTGGGAYSWMTRHADEYGFRRTVPSEIWHWERPAGSQGSFASSGHSDGTCNSQTLNRNVAERTCVESRFDSRWYQCINGSWLSGRGSHGTCSSTHPLGGGSSNDTCQSATLGRAVSVGTCLQSRSDRAWYQCGRNGWTEESSLPGSRRGSAGGCTSVHPL